MAKRGADEREHENGSRCRSRAPPSRGDASPEIPGHRPPRRRPTTQPTTKAHIESSTSARLVRVARWVGTLDAQRAIQRSFDERPGGGSSCRLAEFKRRSDAPNRSDPRRRWWLQHTHATPAVSADRMLEGVAGGCDEADPIHRTFVFESDEVGEHRVAEIRTSIRSSAFRLEMAHRSGAGNSASWNTSFLCGCAQSTACP